MHTCIHACSPRHRHGILGHGGGAGTAAEYLEHVAAELPRCGALGGVAAQQLQQRLPEPSKLPPVLHGHATVTEDLQVPD